MKTRAQTFVAIIALSPMILILVACSRISSHVEFEEVDPALNPSPDASYSSNVNPSTPVFSDHSDDPCPDTAIPKSTAPREEMASAMKGFVGCIKELTLSFQITDQLFSYFKRFELETGAPKLSTLPVSEIMPFLAAHRDTAFTLFGVASPRAKLIRKQFSNSDLEELKALSLMRLNELYKLEGKIFAAVDLRRDLLNYYSTVDRWA
ncbi:MAG: hypothetical protein AABZ55_09995, partial [Bdellovibrionota bacterium]